MTLADFRADYTTCDCTAHRTKGAASGQSASCHAAGYCADRRALRLM
jgi:hypothetical protein